MLKNYFIIGWRNLLRNKGFSAINLFGLSIGMTCTILIFLWVQDELGYNKSHANYAHIYQVMAHRDFNNNIFTDQNMVLPLAQALEDEIPQVEHAVVTTHQQSLDLKYQNDLFRVNGRNVNPQFFEVFTVNYLEGGKDPIAEPGSIVLTESTARAIFGQQQAVNKVLTINGDETLKVTAVIEDIPDNSSIQFDFLMPFDLSDDFIKQAMDNWQNSSWTVFIQTVPEADMAQVDEQINAIKIRNNPGDANISTYFSFPMSKWRLQRNFSQGVNTGGLIQYIRLFTLVAIIILVIACVNFMNLSTARSESRAREVGVRKTLGSLKSQLVGQFLTESVILAFFAFCLSLIAIYMLLPSFNTLVEKQLTIPITNPWFWAGALAIILVTGVLAGSYPSLFLSSFNPVKVLKGATLPVKRTLMPRHVLIIFQFAVSIILISATAVVYQQINMIKNRDIGYNPNNLITITGSGDTQKNYQAIKQELLQTGMVQAVTRTMSPMTAIWWKSPAPNWAGKPDDLNLLVSGQQADVDFTKTMGIKVLEGRDFTGTAADSSYILLNKAAVEKMGLDEAIGLELSYGDEQYSVLGVVENVVQESPFEPVEPMIIFFNPGNAYYTSLRLKDGVMPSEALASIETVFKEYNPHRVFDFQFADQEFQKKFITEELIRKLGNVFAGLAVFICCIGLAGLAAFTIEKRTREISLRKILGATIYQILALLSSGFLKLVLIALAIATPITWWLMHGWLQNYQYQIKISFWIFAGVGLITILLALTVVSINVVKVALRNPTENLRSE